MKWDPAWGEERISNMIATRPDWCISRQRIWGVPIAVFLCEGCGKPLNDPSAEPQGGRAVRARRRRRLVHAAGRRTGSRRAPSAPSAAARSSRKETDILDVWFESGSSHAAVLGHEPGLPWPADLYLEGGDQYRGWFHSSLLCAVGTRESGSVSRCGNQRLDARRAGPRHVEVARQRRRSRRHRQRLGGEIVRLWVASVDFREDVVGSEHLMQRVAESYRKIRNTCSATFSAISTTLIRKRMRCRSTRWTSLDQYMLRQTVAMTADVTRWYDEFAFHKIYHRINDFCVVELSAFYFDVLKDRLVHLCARIPRAPAGRADRDLAHRRGAGPSARAHHELYLRRSVAVSARAARSSRQRASGRLSQRI